MARGSDDPGHVGPGRGGGVHGVPGGFGTAVDDYFPIFLEEGGLVGEESAGVGDGVGVGFLSGEVGEEGSGGHSCCEEEFLRVDGVFLLNVRGRSRGGGERPTPILIHMLHDLHLRL